MSESDPTEVLLEPEPAPRRPGRTLAFAIGILAVLGAGVFAALSLADEGNAPEDPVRAMLEAVEQGDLLGVLEQLEPGERDALRDPMIELVDELNRLDILQGADLGDLRGFDVTIEDLELESERISDDIAAVSIVNGRGTYQFDARRLPLGGFVRELFGEGLEEARSSGEDDLSTDPDGGVTTVRRGGRWYVSIGYSVAEAARRDAGVAFDQLGEGVSPDGAESPEAAVRELVEAARRVDVRRLLELLPPSELSALHDYAGLFLDEVEAGAEEARGSFQVDVATLELDSETSGDRGIVFVREVEFSAEAGGFGRFSYENGCMSVTMPGAGPQRVCEGDDPADVLSGTLFGAGTFGDVLGDVEPPKLPFEGKETRYGIATVRVDGKWYVSPTRTLLDNLVETARLFERRDLEELRRYFEDVFAAMSEGFASYGELEGGSWTESPFTEGEPFYDEECVARAETEEEFEACFPVPTTLRPAG